MILFMEDWTKPENSSPDGSPPIYDLNTPNKSFVEYASLLQQMGIKNWAFPLALHDRTLVGVDPYSEDLTDEQKVRIGIEIVNNPWYFLREGSKVPPTASIDPIPFKAARGNIGMFWLFMNCVSFYLQQPRQTGKSVVSDFIKNYLMHYKLDNAKMILVTLNQQLLGENIERLKNMRMYLPTYTIMKTSKDTQAKESYTYPAKGNTLLSRVSQSSETSATGVGRGCTVPILQFDEAPFIQHMDVIWPAALAATTASRDEAMKAGTIYGTIITSTAGEKTTKSGAFMYDIFKSSADFTEHFFDLQNREELHSVVRKNTKDGSLMVKASFSHRQLGFTDEWLRGKIVETKTTDKDKINRDFFNVWTSSGRLSPISPDVASDILTSERNPNYIFISKSGYMIKWYIPAEEIATYMRENHCIIGADTSEAVNRDSTAFVIINVQTLETVATFSVAEADIIKVAMFVLDFMVAFPKTTLIIENKSTAGTFIETLYTHLPLHGFDPFKRIFNKVVQESDKYPEQFKQITDARVKRTNQFYTQNKNKFGFTTTSASREVLYKEVLLLAAKRCRHLIYDKTLSGELRSLEVNERTGRLDHTSKGHDDHVMAWCLAMWFLLMGKNLNWYGLETRRVMAKVNESGIKLDDSQLKEKELIESYQEELDQLIVKLAEHEDTVYKQVIEHQVRRVQQKLSHFGVEVRNVDSMLNEVKEKRKQKAVERARRAQYSIN